MSRGSKKDSQRENKKIKKVSKNLLTNGTECAIIIKVSEREPNSTT